MLNKLKKNNSEKGFTIIEVMIVLAIAGLILLIVFLAVPALQRNSRNTQRKNDVAALLAAVSEYSNNNNGTLPATCSGTAPVVLGTAPTTVQAKVGYYNQGCSTGAPTSSGKVQVKAAYSATGALSTNTSNDWVIITPASSCGAGGSATAGSTRQITAVYQIETGAGTYNSVCQEG